MKEILKELKKYRGRGTVEPKAEFFHNTAIDGERYVLAENVEKYTEFDKSIKKVLGFKK